MIKIEKREEIFKNQHARNERHKSQQEKGGGGERLDYSELCLIAIFNIEMLQKYFFARHYFKMFHLEIFQLQIFKFFAVLNLEIIS